MISVVIPTLNAGAHLSQCLHSLLDGAMEGLIREVVVSDGGSSDATLAIADDAGCVIVSSERGRGGQLQRGAAKARAAWMLFLHADTVLDAGWTRETGAFIKSGADKAAYFRFTPDAQDARARRLAWLVRMRCALFALPFGDQGLLISRTLYEGIGGFRDIALMEDVDLVRRLGRGRLHALETRAITSVARHRREGYFKRSLKNTWLLGRFLLGADPNDLAKRYE